MKCRQTRSKAFLDTERRRKATMKGNDICDSHEDEGTETESTVEESKPKRRWITEEGGYTLIGWDRPKSGANAPCCCIDRLEEERLLVEEVKLLATVQYGVTITEWNDVIKLMSYFGALST